jgi:hypothetical protein
MTAAPSSQPTPEHPQGPGPHPSVQVPAGYVLAPAPKKKGFVRRHKLLSLVLLVVVVVVLAQLAGGGDDGAPAPAGSSTTSPATEAQDTPPGEEPAPPAEAAPGVGTPVADGKLQFTVTSVEAGVPSIGDDLFGVTAQGQYVLVHMTVTNVGDAAQLFDASSQTLLDGQGRTHSADSGAAIYLPDSNSFLTSINPGNTVDGIVVFDVPADATPVSVELHDSPFSGGVTVSLG